MNPIKVVMKAKENADWKEDEEVNERIREEWKMGKFSTIAPDLLRMYVEDAITLDEISKAWKVPKFYIIEMYRRAKIVPYRSE